MTRTLRILFQLSESLVAAALIALLVVGGLLLVGALLSVGGAWSIAAGIALAATPLAVGGALYALRELR